MALLTRRTRLLTGTAALVLGIACSNGSGSPASSKGASGEPDAEGTTPPDPSNLDSGNAGYGLQLIGYKNGRSAAQLSQGNMDSAASSAAPALAPSEEGYSSVYYAYEMDVAASAGASSTAAGSSPGSGGSAALPNAGTGGSAALPNAGTGGVPTTPSTGGNAGAQATGGTPTTEGGAGPEQAEPESPEAVVENPFWDVIETPVSTFSIDADSGSYTLARAAIRDGVMPDPESVRSEEFLNYFHFHYAEPPEDQPLALYTELGVCAWNSKHELLLLGVQGHEVDMAEQPPANLVYLLDVSGSMNSAEKLPLLKRGFRMLTGQLRAEDRVSIVVYAGQERVVLEGVSGADKATINEALTALESGGSTNGAGGIQKAYELAQEYFIDGGTNRVLLATDGDFNVGLSSTEELVDFIATKRETGVFLSVYGFGTAWEGGNYQDEVGEQLADNGNGVYFYIDGDEEARRAFIYTISGSLITVAKDVKVQVAFNPEQVAAYRLIGYENRLLAENDFSNDAVDAGELGASMSVTALYEIVPAGSGEAIVEPLPGTVPEMPESTGTSDEPEPDYPEMGTKDFAQIRIRYKNSDSDTSQLIVETRDRSIWREESSSKFHFAAGVGEFAMGLRGSQYLPRLRGEALKTQIELALPLDGEGAVAEMSTLVQDVMDLRR